jgi:hypothetical protein
LYRETTPVDQDTGAPIDRKRRFVADVDVIGIEPPPCAAQLVLVQDRVPLTTTLHRDRWRAPQSAPPWP